MLKTYSLQIKTVKPNLSTDVCFYLDCIYEKGSQVLLTKVIYYIDTNVFYWKIHN